MMASKIFTKQPGRLAILFSVVTGISIFISAYLFFGSAMVGLVFSVASTVKSFREPGYKSRKILKIIFGVLGIILFSLLAFVGVAAIAVEQCGRKYGSC